MSTNHVTNANRPKIAADYPVAGGGDADGGDAARSGIRHA